MQPEPTLGHDGGAGSGLDTLGHDGGGDSGLDSLLSSAYDVPVAQARLVREPDGNTQTTGKLTNGSRAYIGIYNEEKRLSISGDQLPLCKAFCEGGQSSLVHYFSCSRKALTLPRGSTLRISSSLISPQRP